jgi:hypothetical protein
MRRLEQGAKIGNEVACRARHRHGRTPAQMIRVKKCSGSIVRAYPRELGYLRKNAAQSRFEFSARNIGIISVTRLENYRRAARSSTLEIHLAASADVDQTVKIPDAGMVGLLCDRTGGAELRLNEPSEVSWTCFCESFSSPFSLQPPRITPARVSKPKLIRTIRRKIGIE